MNKVFPLILMLLIPNAAFLALIPTAKATTIPDVYVMPLYIWVGKVGRTFDVNVYLADAGASMSYEVYGYEFKLSFDPSMLEVVEIANGTYLPPYPDSYNWKMDFDNGAGIIWVAVSILGHATPPDFTGGLLATITFNATRGVTYPSQLSCPLHLYDVKLSNDAGFLIEPITVSDAVYYYAPIRGDIDGNGIVDIFDVAVVALAFGSTPGYGEWDPRADLNADGIVDILDATIIGVNFNTEG